MSLQGHVDAIKRHLRKAGEADNRQDRDRNLHHARVAHRNLCRECETMSDKQVERESREALQMWKYGVAGL